MAIVKSTATIFDGNRRVSLQVSGISDGAGQLTLEPLAIASAFNPAAKALKVLKVAGSVSYGVVELYWEALPPVKFLTLSGDSICFDFSETGALNKAAAGADATGNILISTIGFSAGSTYSLQIDMTKQYRDKVLVV